MKPAPVIFLFALAPVGGLTGCGADLGTCDMTAYQAEVAANGGIHPGQQQVNGNCAGGMCHSAAATGGIRRGAPAELDFDTLWRDPSTGATPQEQMQLMAQMARASVGIATVQEWAEDMWGEVDGGTMPPGRSLTGEAKEQMRHWLACGAQPLPSPSTPVDPGANDLEQAAPALVMDCQGCHNAAAAPGFMTTLSLGADATTMDVCAIYQALTTTKASASCDANRDMIEVGSPDTSYLIGKLDGTDLCNGALMPFGRTEANLYSDTNASTYEQLRAWIMNGAPKPDSCP